MGACSVPECTNRTENGVKIRQCPKAPIRRQKWINYLLENGWDKEKQISKYFHICNIHFPSHYTGNDFPEKEDPSVPKGTWKSNEFNEEHLEETLMDYLDDSGISNAHEIDVSNDNNPEETFEELFQEKPSNLGGEKDTSEICVVDKCSKRNTMENTYEG